MVTPFLQESTAVSTRDLVHIALFTAIVAALGLVPPVPVPVIGVPITAQTMGVMLAGSVLGAKRGALSLLLFLALVAAGAPLLAGGRGGLGVFFGPSGGFLIGFPIAAGVIGWMVERWWSRLGFWTILAIHLLGGVVVLYAIGVPFVAAVTGLPLSAALVGSLWFVAGDIAKAAIAAYVAVTVRRTLPMVATASARRDRSS